MALPARRSTAATARRSGPSRWSCDPGRERAPRRARRARASSSRRCRSTCSRWGIGGQSCLADRGRDPADGGAGWRPTPRRRSIRTIARAPSSLAPPDPMPTRCLGRPSRPDEQADTRREARPAWDAFDGPIVLFLVAALLSLLATEYLRLSLRELRTLVVEPVLFWYLCRARPPFARAMSAWLGRPLRRRHDARRRGRAGAARVRRRRDRRAGRPPRARHLHFAEPLCLAARAGAAVSGGITWSCRAGRRWAAAAALVCAGALVATFSVGGWLGTGLGVLVVVGLLGGRRVVLGLALAGSRGSRRFPGRRCPSSVWPGARSAPGHQLARSSSGRPPSSSSANRRFSASASTTSCIATRR